MDELCPNCGEVLPPDAYWERFDGTPTRQEAYRVRHWRQRGGWCKGFAGPPRNPLDRTLRLIAHDLAQAGQALARQLGA